MDKLAAQMFEAGYFSMLEKIAVSPQMAMRALNRGGLRQMAQIPQGYGTLDRVAPALNKMFKQSPRTLARAGVPPTRAGMLQDSSRGTLKTLSQGHQTAHNPALLKAEEATLGPNILSGGKMPARKGLARANSEVAQSARPGEHAPIDYLRVLHNKPGY
jgi:hypothetical protein